MNTNDTPTPSSTPSAEASDPLAGRCAVATGSTTQHALSLEAAILWGEGDESLGVSLGLAAAMEPTEDEGSAAARLLSAEVRRLRADKNALSEACHVFLDARKHDGYGMDDAETAIRAALSNTRNQPTP